MQTSAKMHAQNDLSVMIYDYVLYALILSYTLLYSTPGSSLLLIQILHHWFLQPTVSSLPLLVMDDAAPNDFKTGGGELVPIKQ